MKKILPYIFVFLIIANLFAPFSVGIQRSIPTITPTVAEAAGCLFLKDNGITITPINKPDNGVVTITIQVTKDCLTGIHNIWVELYNQNRTPDYKVIAFPIDKISNTTITTTLTRGENGCSNSNSCDIYVRGYTDATVTGVGVVTKNADEYSSEDKSMYSYTCAKADSCNQSLNWKDAIDSGPVNTGTEADKATAAFNAAKAAADKVCAAADAETDPTKKAKLTEQCTQALKNLEILSSARSLATTADYNAAKAAADKVCAAADAETDPTKKAQLTEQCTQAKNIAEAKFNKAVTGGGVGPSRNGSGLGSDIMPECWLGITSGFSVSGCFAQLIYGAIFVPTSFLLALTGKFFDFTFAYSVNDQSYRSDFVVQGWGVVRDFCNMFFIFVLLYIAFATMLNLHGAKPKEMIINVVIIGLLINFSLFTAQVVIDASNIMARVFYNDKAIVVGDMVDGKIIGRPGTNNEIQLSAALVNKVDPQRLIIRARDVGTIDDPAGQTTNQANKGGVTTGTFILVTILASAINIVGMIVFLSVGMIFIARVIGLWMSMIFAPLAFFTYTVPSMQGWGMVGWRKWWPELLSMAFLAPVFIFFLYLIIKFLNKGLGLISAGDQAGNTYLVLSIVIPFAFIMVLLMKAKDIAKSMSGSLGQSITNGVAAVGGVALGAGVGTAAFLGRNTLGRVAERFDKSNFLNEAASGKKGRIAQFFTKDIGIKKLATKTAKGSFDFRQTGAANVFSKETGMNLNKGLSIAGLDTKSGLGGYRGVQERKIEKENKFGESLGFNHHDYEDAGDKVSNAETELAKFKADPNQDHNSSTYKAAVARQENEIAGLKKMQERIKTSRQKEYELTVKRKSGKIYDIDMTDEEYRKAKEAVEKFPNNEAAKERFRKLQTYRDEYGNIKKFGHAHDDAAKAGAQIAKEFVTGMAKGMAAGMVAGSVIPGVGTAAGLIGGGLAGGIRELMHYSGTSNRHVGEKHDHSHEPKDKYVAPTPSAPSGGHGGGGHDDHGGDNHGGGGHH